MLVEQLNKKYSVSLIGRTEFFGTIKIAENTFIKVFNLRFFYDNKMIGQ